MKQALLALACTVAAVLPVRGQERVMRPDAAVKVALPDARALTEENAVLALTSRYVMANEPYLLTDSDGKQTDATRAGLSLAANVALLHAADTYRLAPIGDGSVFRVDMDAFAGRDPAKLRLLLDTWDRIQDTQFYLATDKTREVATIRYKHGGKTWDRVTVKVVVPLAHADINGQLSELITITGSAAPIVSVGQFLRFTLNSDFGGLYPEFRGFDLSPEKGTAEQAFLLRAGTDLKDLGNNNSDQRVFLMRKPTSSPGIIEYVWSDRIKASKGPAVTTITRDFFTGFIDQRKHPLENLADRNHDGSEIFGPTPAGGLEFALFNGKGDFVRSAPLNPPNSLASDRTIPAPFLPVLQGPSGCIRCHIQENPDTKISGIYQPAPNWINWLRDVQVNGKPWDVFADKGDADEKLARLVSLYEGDTKDAFALAGQTFAKFCFQASGLKMEDSCRAMMGMHDAWLYSYVTPVKAMLTLGYKCQTEAEAVALFNQLCPPRTPEPLRVTQFRAWTEGDKNNAPRSLPMTIDDWLSVYPEVAARVLETEQTDKTEAEK